MRAVPPHKRHSPVCRHCGHDAAGRKYGTAAMPSRKKGTEQRLAKQKRKEWDAMIKGRLRRICRSLTSCLRLHSIRDSMQEIMKITSDFKISGACWDAVNDKLMEIHDMLDVVGVQIETASASISAQFTRNKYCPKSSISEPNERSPEELRGLFHHGPHN